MSKYNEIVKLHEMLLEANIEHVWVNRNPEGYPKRLRDGTILDFGWHIVVYRPNGARLISVIEGYGTYGVEVDRLEIMGLLTPEELEYNDVAGWLTADDVFERIVKVVNEND